MRVLTGGSRHALFLTVLALILSTPAHDAAIAQSRQDLNGLKSEIARLYREGRFNEGVELTKQAILLAQQNARRDPVTLANLLNSLGLMYSGQGEYALAEPAYRQALQLAESKLGPNHESVATILNNIAELYRNQDRTVEAEPIYMRSLSISLKAPRRDPQSIAHTLSNLGLLYDSQGRYKKAEPLFNDALALLEKTLGADHEDVATVLDNLAGCYESQKEYGKAEPLYRRALDLRVRKLGPEHPDVATVLNNLAALYDSQKRFDEAEPLYRRSLSIRKKVLSPDDPLLNVSLNNIAVLHAKQEDWATTADYWRQSTEIIKRRVQSGQTGMQEGSATGESAHLGWQFAGLIKATYRIVSGNQRNLDKLAGEMFEVAQWGQGSDAAAAVALMAARGSQGDAGLSALIREQQDLHTERRAKFDQLVGLSGDPANERILKSRLADMENRLAAVSAQLARDFPEHVSLSTFKAVSLSSVQTELRGDEALVLILDTDDRIEPFPDELFVWIVTKTEMRWLHSDLGGKALAREVTALRCGLDTSGWLAENSKCKELTGVDFTENDSNAGYPPPFDISRAYALYESLFGKAGDLIKGRHLLIAANGALSQLPFHALVSAKPETQPDANMRQVAWLARSNPITVLPAVASLTTLRKSRTASTAPEPFIGFGNPLLKGRCAQVEVPDGAVAANAPEAKPRSIGVASRAAAYFREGLADVEAVRGLCPLPDTAHELKCVARSLEAGPGTIVLGADMTETAIKKTPLDRYRIIHFATHGMLAGEMATMSKARAEPALVMTPPKFATQEDDGLLTASEVANLKLNADWVVMSACNTAAGGASDAEALSGLARAFFYAGARALLASHWPVDSYAATQLTSRTFAEMRQDKSMGRSEALRRAMLVLIDDRQNPWAAHPSVWAPFVVVGEGGAN